MSEEDVRENKNGLESKRVEMTVEMEPAEGLGDVLDKYVRDNARREINRGMIKDWESIYRKFMDGSSTKYLSSITKKYNRDEIECIIRIMNFMIKGGYEVDGVQ